MEEKKKGKEALAKQKQQLSQYRRLLREIRAERARLSQLCSHPEKGAAGLPALSGCAAGELETYRRHIDENLSRCLSLAVSLQQYINDIRDSETRRLFILHYIYGYSWQKVAFAMDGFDESMPRKKHDRYLQAHPHFAIPPDPRAGERIDDIDAVFRREVSGIGL